jgi:hypothetical protein
MSGHIPQMPEGLGEGEDVGDEDMGDEEEGDGMGGLAQYNLDENTL